VPEDFVHHAKILLLERRYLDAVRVCREGLDADPDHLEGQVVLDMLLIALARFREVCEEQVPAVDASPSNHRARRLLITACECLGEHKRALALRQEEGRHDSPGTLIHDFLDIPGSGGGQRDSDGWGNEEQKDLGLSSLPTPPNAGFFEVGQNFFEEPPPSRMPPDSLATAVESLLDDLDRQRESSAHATSPARKTQDLTTEPPEHNLTTEPPEVHQVSAAWMIVRERSQTRPFLRRGFEVALNARANELLDFGHLFERLKTGGPEAVRQIEREMREVASKYPGTPRERQRLRWLSTWWRARLHLLLSGDHEWPPHRVLLQLAQEHADRSALTLSAESWLSVHDPKDLRLITRTRPDSAGEPACLATIDVGAPILDVVVDREGRVAIVLTRSSGDQPAGTPARRFFKVDLETMEVSPIETDSQGSVAPEQLRRILPNALARRVHDRIVRLPNMELAGTYADLVVERVGVHPPPQGNVPVMMLEDGLHLVSGTSDGLLRVWDLEVLADSYFWPKEDPWAREVLDRVWGYVESIFPNGWEGWKARSHRISSDVLARLGVPESLREINTDMWELMNWGSERVAFLIVSPFRIDLRQIEPPGLLASWFSRFPLVESLTQSADISPRLWLVREGPYLALETASGLAVALRLMRGGQKIDPCSIEQQPGHGASEPPPWRAALSSSPRSAPPR
jgi:hypothetical protein